MSRDELAALTHRIADAGVYSRRCIEASSALSQELLRTRSKANEFAFTNCAGGVALCTRAPCYRICNKEILEPCSKFRTSKEASAIHKDKSRVLSLIARVLLVGDASR